MKTISTKEVCVPNSETPMYLDYSIVKGVASETIPSPVKESW